MFQQVISIIQTISIVAVPFVMYKVMNRSLRTQVDEIVETYLPMAKKTMTLVGNKGVETKQMKTAEKMVMGDIMAAEMPEVEVIKGYLSGDTLAYLEENPQVLPALYKKYAPMLEGMASRFMGNDGKKEVSYDV